MHISIHPQQYDGRPFPNGAGVAFYSPRNFHPENSNSIELVFTSPEYNARKDPTGPEDGFQVADHITVFRLSAVDAELLSSIGLMSDKQRAEILPIVREILEQTESDDG